jgi:PTS system mannose-specific IIC component
MSLSAGELLMLVLFGGVVAIDGTSFGQFMISRPLVAATLAGALVGNPIHGALIGGILEAFHLSVLPVGAAKYPEGGPAAVVGGAIYATSDLAASTLLLTLVIVLGLEWLGGESVRILRQANVRLIRAGNPVDMTPESLERRHFAAIGIDFARGMVLVLAGILGLSALLDALRPLWGLGEQVPQILLSAVVAGLLASTFRSLGGRRWMAAAGVGAGLLFVLLGR